MRPLFCLLVPAIALAAPVPKAKPTKLLITSLGKVIMVNPDGTDEKVVLESAEKLHVTRALLTPDQRHIVYSAQPPDRKGERALYVRLIADGTETEVVSGFDLRVSFLSADGKTAYGTDRDPKAKRKPGGGDGDWGRSWAIDLATGGRTDIDVSGEYLPLCVMSGTGDIAMLRTWGDNLRGPPAAKNWMATVTTDPKKWKPTTVIEEAFRTITAFPDGKRWLVRDPLTNRPAVYTVGEKAPEKWHNDATAYAPNINPDGTRMVYSNPEPNYNTPSALSTYALAGVAGAFPKVVISSPNSFHIYICDLDGKNATEVTRVDKVVYYIDWR